MVNKVILVGNLGNDPEVRSTTGGTNVASFPLATTRKWNKDGVKQEKTEWHRVQAWGKLADVVKKYVKKGDRLYVEGRVEYRQWDDKDGNKRYSTEIVCENLTMLGSSRSGSTGPKAEDEAPAKTATEVMDQHDDDDDDLPFK